jgi:hypothetical protein
MPLLIELAVHPGVKTACRSSRPDLRELLRGPAHLEGARARRLGDAESVITTIPARPPRYSIKVLDACHPGLAVGKDPGRYRIDMPDGKGGKRGALRRQKLTMIFLKWVFMSQVPAQPFGMTKASPG